MNRFLRMHVFCAPEKNGTLCFSLFGLGRRVFMPSRWFALKKFLTNKRSTASMSFVTCSDNKVNHSILWGIAKIGSCLALIYQFPHVDFYFAVCSFPPAFLLHLKTVISIIISPVKVELHS